MSNLYISEQEPGLDSFTVEGEQTARPIGGRVKPVGHGLFGGIDMLNAAKEEASGYHLAKVTSNYQLSEAETRRHVRSLISRHMLDGEGDGTKKLFIDAIIDCYIINGSSRLMPDRAEFTIQIADAIPRTFNYYSDVVAVLGDDTRRFFRAFADYTKKRIKDLITEVERGIRDGSDESASRWDARRQLFDEVTRNAADRGMSRYVYLCFDTAEACTGLTVPERAAVMAAKSAVVSSSSGGNSIDGIYSNSGMNIPQMQAKVAKTQASVSPVKYDDY